MPANIIELTDLTKAYNTFKAVDQLNLNINRGEIFGLLGPNGAGKSTVILMMLGLTEPTAGHISICGIDPKTAPLEIKRRVGYLPEDVGFYNELTGLENLIYTGKLNRLTQNEAAERAKQLLKRVGLIQDADKKAGKYSRGMRQRLGLADVLIKNPEIIILDEPTLGIDPTGVRELLDLIIKLSKEEGLTVLLSSHDLHNVQKMCDRVGLFVQGRLLADGNIQSLAEKLSDKHPYTIETGISGYKNDLKGTEDVCRMIMNISGVQSVVLQENLFRVECNQDISTEIARTVIRSGLDLTYLNKKEFALNDIYYRYFEGVTNHEKNQ